LNNPSPQPFLSTVASCEDFNFFGTKLTFLIPQETLTFPSPSNDAQHAKSAVFICVQLLDSRMKVMMKKEKKIVKKNKSNLSRIKTCY